MSIERLVPLGRFTTIGETGEAVSFLASDRAALIVALGILVLIVMVLRRFKI